MSDSRESSVLEEETLGLGEEAPVEKDREVSHNAQPSSEVSEGDISLAEELEETFSSLIEDAPKESPKKSPAMPPAQPQAPPLSRAEETRPDLAGAAVGDFIDLSEILEEESPQQEAIPEPTQHRDRGLHSAISAFQDQATAEPVNEDDYETHYNLGIAYSEMGLLNEAIQEFKISAGSDSRFIDSRTMLSVCYRKKGMIPEVIKVLEEALGDARCDDSQQRWITYDLANVYEEQERTEEALTLYTKIYDKDPAFKDVGRRVDKLRKQLGQAEGNKIIRKRPEEKEEDVDSMIENMLGDTASEDVRKDEKDDGKKKSRISYI